MADMNRGYRNAVAIILAGGSGTRFWPLSTGSRPKQFLALIGEKSLLRLAWERIEPVVGSDRVLVLTGQDFVDIVRRELPDLPPGNVIGEPVARDTAAAVALGTALARHRHGDPVVAVLTADHWIEPVDRFRDVVASALEAASSSGCLYTFGIAPTWPATGYGYLECGRPVLEDRGIMHHEVVCFREKPDRATAQTFLAGGRHFWNSGMFVWRAGVFWEALRRHLPGHASRLEPVAALDRSPGFPASLAAAFDGIERVSVDFGVMEKVPGIRMVKAPFTWSDVGGWLALEPWLDPDPSGNLVRGRVRAHEARSNLVISEDPDEVVALVGVRDLVIVRAGRRTLVVHRDAVEKVKTLVESFRGDPDLEKFL